MKHLDKMTHLDKLKKKAREDLILKSQHLHLLIKNIIASPNVEIAANHSFSDYLLEEALKDLIKAYNTQKKYHSPTFKPAVIAGKSIKNKTL